VLRFAYEDLINDQEYVVDLLHSLADAERWTQVFAAEADAADRRSSVRLCAGDLVRL
jgi:hypothetical protein